MRKIVNIGMLIFVVITICNLNNCANDEIKVIKYEIAAVINELPLDTLSFLHGPNSIRVLNDTIYITDRSNNRVVILSKDFRYAESLGKLGRGPSEFYGPTVVVPHKDSVYVFDHGNSRVQIFNKERSYIGGFNIVMHPRTKPAVTSRGNILIRSQGDIDDSALFRELNTRGEIVADIGEPYDKDSNIPYVSNLVSMETDIADNRYVAFYELPIVRKYNSSGELLWETNFNSIEPISNRVKEIEETKKEGSLSHSLIHDISLSDQRLYVLFSFGDKYRNVWGIDTRTGKIIERVDTDGAEHFKLSMDFVDDTLYFVDYMNNVIVIAKKR